MGIDQIEKIEAFLRDYAKKQGMKGFIVGMSGGKDSLVCAKLCANAVGAENVLGLIMPNGEMRDFDVAVRCCDEVGIKYEVVNLKNSYNDILQEVKTALKVDIKSQTTINIAPRLRMTMLYALAASLDYLVVNTSNLSEKMVGYTTKWGDNVGDIAPIADFTKGEVCEIGLKLGLEPSLVNKIPDDGLSGSSDEEILGVSYLEIDKQIRFGNSEKRDIINKLYKQSSHKRVGVVTYKSGLKNYFLEEK